MSTRGLYGFRKNGIDKLTYNHSDSYPDWLGDAMITFCKNTSIEEMNAIFNRIVLVDEHDKPTKKQIEECIKYYNGNVGTQKVEDWYCLLRNTQGNLNVYKDGLKYMIDSQDFIYDSLFCEYAYIINLDEECLEFYVGFQKTPEEFNRYGTESDDGYYHCKIVAEFWLNDIVNSTVEDIVEDMNEAVDKEFNGDTEEQEEERDVTEDDLYCIAEDIKNGFTSAYLDNGIKWRLEFDI